MPQKQTGSSGPYRQSGSSGAYRQSGSSGRKGGARLLTPEPRRMGRLARILMIGALAVGVGALTIGSAANRARNAVDTSDMDLSAFPDGAEESIVETVPEKDAPSDDGAALSGDDGSSEDADVISTQNASAEENMIISESASNDRHISVPDGGQILISDADGQTLISVADDVLTLEQVRTVRFADMPAEQNIADAVSYSACVGIFSGFPDGTFHPDTLLTRGQAVTILRRAARAVQAGRMTNTRNGSDGKTGVYRLYETVRDQVVELFSGPDASGVTEEENKSGTMVVEYVGDAGNAAESDVEWAVRTGILSVSGDYQLDALITRAQFAAFLYRLAAHEGMDLSCTGNLSRRIDADQVPEYAYIPLSWAMEHNIYRTIVEDGLCPQIALSRGQAALLLTGFLADALKDPVAEQITQNAQKPFPESKSRADHDRIQDVVSRVAEKYGSIGVQVAVIENGHVTDTYAYGWATKNSDWMDAYHPMRIASISKVILGMNTLRAAQDGLISLDAPLDTYWDASFQNPYYPDIPVTIRTILTHTSSVSDGNLTAASVRVNLQRKSGWRDTPPGSIVSWEYSNYGFGILGMTLERATGKTMDRILWEYFLRAMDIDASFYAGDLADTSHLTTLYYHDGSVSRPLKEQRATHTGAVGSDGAKFPGGLVISAADLAKFAALLVNDGVYEGLRLLEETSVAEMENVMRDKTPDGFYQGQPLRYRANVYGRGGIYYHTGSAYGVYNGFSYDPETGDGIVVLTTGASAVHDANGNYAVCGDIFDYIYHAIANGFPHAIADSYGKK